MSEKEERPLPEGWFSSVDEESGNTYYYQEGGSPQWNFPGDPEITEEEPENNSTEDTKDSIAEGFEIPPGASDEAQSVATFHRSVDETSTSASDMSATSENTTSEPAKSSEPVVSVEENTVSNQQPASESAAKEVIPAKSKEKEKKKKKEKSPSKLTTSSSDLPEFLQKIEKYVMKKFVSFCFFPFQGINCLIIYLLPQLLWLLAEFICSVVYLANNGLPKGLERQIFLNSGCEKGYFMPAWMLVDSLAGFADLALHMIVMSKPAQVLKADTPSIFSSPFNVITEEKGNAKLMYKIGLLSWTIFRMFSFIWTFIGSVFLAITRYSWNTMSKEGNIIQTMPHRLCFYIRNWQKNPFTKYTIVYPFDIANGDSPVFATPSGLMQFTSFCLMLNWFSLGCTVTIGCFACFVRVVFRHMAGVAAETSAEINANNASPFVESQ